MSTLFGRCFETIPHTGAPRRLAARRFHLAALLLAILPLVAWASPSDARPARAFNHVFLLILENREYQPGGGPPYLARIARQGTLATEYFGVSHPSLPNYLALLSGSTHGITSDCTDCLVNGRTLVDQLEAAGLSWGAFMEDMPSRCFTGSFSGLYAMKHDPFMYFPSIRNTPRRCDRVQPLSALAPLLRRGGVPNFTWITPNLCHDGHDCGTDAVDSFLRSFIPPILTSAAYRDRGALFITYDEGTTDAGCCRLAHGGRVETVAIGAGIKRGSTLTAQLDHYSLLRSIEDGLGLPHLGGAACGCTAPLIRGLHGP